MRASRLVALLLAVQRKGSTTAPALAEELEVSVRTVYRDIAALQEAGVPLWTEPGPHGGVRLVEGWRTSLDGLTGDEAAALFLAGAPSSAVAELGLGTVLAAAQSKVLSTLPPELRGRAARVRERFHLDAPGWFQRGEQHPHLGAVADAVWRERRLRLRYRRGGSDEDVQRTVDPLGLVLKAGTWYLVARTRRGVVTYRVSRITGAEVLDATFERPSSFDLGAWWDQSGAEFDRSLRRVHARLRLSPFAARRLADAVGILAAREALATAAPDADGWVTVEIDVESAEVAADQLFALGDGVEALAPPELRDRLRTAATALAARNA